LARPITGCEGPEG